MKFSIEKNIINFLDEEIKHINNEIQRDSLLSLYDKVIKNSLSKEDIFELIDIVSRYIELDVNGNPINKTLEAEELIDELLNIELGKKDGNI
jgi:hypothetical protein